jgi:hypothetical protein
LTAEEIREQLKEMVEIGEDAPKANYFPFQESSKTDQDCVDYNKYTMY